jgi:hypothetical protein
MRALKRDSQPSAKGRIIPTFPEGHSQCRNGIADQLNDRAEECRALAAFVHDPGCRAKLLRLADTYQVVANGAAAVPQI